MSDRVAAALRLVRSDDWSEEPTGVAARCAAALGMDGLAISLAAQGGLMEVMWSFGASSRGFEELQFALGEGPGLDAMRGGSMVCVPDLAASRPDRWPTLAGETAGLPVRAVFCFPLGLGAIHLGVLTAVRHEPGSLTAQLTDDALVLAAAVTARLLGGDAEGNPLDAPHTPHRAVVHQATGMISVQLDVSLSEALLRLRAHAFGSGRSLNDVSDDVVHRRLRLASNADYHTNDGDRDGTDPSGGKRDGSS